MVVLGRIEGTVRLNFCDDGLLERTGLIELGDVGFRDLGLLGVVGKIAERYCGPKSGPCRLSSRRIVDDREKDLKYPPIADLARVVSHLHRFRVARPAAAHDLVRAVFFSPPA